MFYNKHPYIVKSILTLIIINFILMIIFSDTKKSKKNSVIAYSSTNIFLGGVILMILFMNYTEMTFVQILYFIIGFITFMYISLFIAMRVSQSICESKKRSYKMMIESIILIMILIYIIENGKSGFKKVLMIFIFITILMSYYKQ